MKYCQWCDGRFAPSVSYQIYCSEECRNGATKEKVAERYSVTRRARLMSKARKCKSCSSPLSAYNDETLCAVCLVNPTDVSKALKEIRGLIDEA